MCVYVRACVCDITRVASRNHQDGNCIGTARPLQAPPPAHTPPSPQPPETTGLLPVLPHELSVRPHEQHDLLDAHPGVRRRSGWCLIVAAATTCQFLSQLPPKGTWAASSRGLLGITPL